MALPCLWGFLISETYAFIPGVTERRNLVLKYSNTWEEEAEEKLKIVANNENSPLEAPPTTEPRENHHPSDPPSGFNEIAGSEAATSLTSWADYLLVQSEAPDKEPLLGLDTVDTLPEAADSYLQETTEPRTGGKSLVEELSHHKVEYAEAVKDASVGESFSDDTNGSSKSEPLPFFLADEEMVGLLASSYEPSLVSLTKTQPWPLSMQSGLDSMIDDVLPAWTNFTSKVSTTIGFIRDEVAPKLATKAPEVKELVIKFVDVEKPVLKNTPGTTIQGAVLGVAGLTLASGQSLEISTVAGIASAYLCVTQGLAGDAARAGGTIVWEVLPTALTWAEEVTGELLKGAQQLTSTLVRELPATETTSAVINPRPPQTPPPTRLAETPFFLENLETEIKNDEADVQREIKAADFMIDNPTLEEKSVMPMVPPEASVSHQDSSALSREREESQRQLLTAQIAQARLQRGLEKSVRQEDCQRALLTARLRNMAAEHRAAEDFSVREPMNSQQERDAEIRVEAQKIEWGKLLEKARADAESEKAWSRQTEKMKSISETSVEGLHRISSIQESSDRVQVAKVSENEETSPAFKGVDLQERDQRSLVSNRLRQDLREKQRRHLEALRRSEEKAERVHRELLAGRLLQEGMEREMSRRRSSIDAEMTRELAQRQLLTTRLTQERLDVNKARLEKAGLLAKQKEKVLRRLLSTRLQDRQVQLSGARIAAIMETEKTREQRQRSLLSYRLEEKQLRTLTRLIEKERSQEEVQRSLLVMRLRRERLELSAALAAASVEDLKARELAQRGLLSHRLKQECLRAETGKLSVLTDKERSKELSQRYLLASQLLQKRWEDPDKDTLDSKTRLEAQSSFGEHENQESLRPDMGDGENLSDRRLPRRTRNTPEQPKAGALQQIVVDKTSTETIHSAIVTNNMVERRHDREREIATQAMSNFGAQTSFKTKWLEQQMKSVEEEINAEPEIEVDESEKVRLQLESRIDDEKRLRILTEQVEEADPADVVPSSAGQHALGSFAGDPPKHGGNRYSVMKPTKSARMILEDEYFNQLIARIIQAHIAKIKKKRAAEAALADDFKEVSVLIPSSESPQSNSGESIESFALTKRKGNELLASILARIMNLLSRLLRRPLKTTSTRD